MVYYRYTGNKTINQNLLYKYESFTTLTKKIGDFKHKLSRTTLYFIGGIAAIIGLIAIWYQL